MAVFKNEQYPELSMHDGEVEWARFHGGRLESSDASVVKRLRSEGSAALGVTEVKPIKKSD